MIILEPGRHLVYEMQPGRNGWIHIVSGEVRLSDLTLIRGDGVGVIDEASVSLTAQVATEVLLIEAGKAGESFD